MGKRNRERIARIEAGQEQPISKPRYPQIMDKGEVLKLRKGLYKPTAKEIEWLGGK